MGLEIGGDELAPAGHALRIGADSVGQVVAGFHSPNLDRNLGYAYLNAPHFRPGTLVTLDIDAKETAATVVDMPFLDPDGRRMRA
jgi:glycine cleavage system T protein (aminomethyltransferase)